MKISEDKLATAVASLGIMITFEDFSKLELKVGTVLVAEEVKGSEKLIKFQIDLGEEDPRQVLAGIKTWYDPKDLVGKQVTVVANLEPRKMMGEESNCMILMVGDSEPVFLIPQKKVLPGAKAR